MSSEALDFDLEQNTIARRQLLAIAATAPKTDADKPKRFKAKSGRELMATEFEPRKWFVDDLITTGLMLLAAPPKSYKSWLALDLAMGMANGGRFLGLPVQVGKVLYVDLEKDDAGLSERIRAYCDAQAIDTHGEWAGNLDYMTLDEAESYFDGSGNTEPLQQWLDDNSGAQMIVVDMLAAWQRPPQVKGNAYEVDYQAMRPLRAFAIKNKIALLLIHHTNKTGQGAGAISGSNGIAGNADVYFVLRKDGEESLTATLQVNGNPIRNPRKLALEWRPDKLYWHCQGDAEKVRLNQTDDRIKATLESNPGELFTAKQICDLLSDEGDNQPVLRTVRRRLHHLAGIGLIRKTRHDGKTELFGAKGTGA